MKAAFEVIDRMQVDGIIAHYAIGGDVAASYYSEPATTLPMEVYVTLPFDSNGLSASLAALRKYLIAQGHKIEGAGFEIEGWLVRFVVASNNLEREAVASSLPVDVDGERLWVMMAEHLMAIALVANRTSDRPWMLRLTERDAIDELTLKSILNSHDLIEKWALFQENYPPQFPSKQEMRQKMAGLSFSEKIKILEKLRDRSLAFAEARQKAEGIGGRKMGRDGSQH